MAGSIHERPGWEDRGNDTWVVPNSADIAALGVRASLNDLFERGRTPGQEKIKMVGPYTLAYSVTGTGRDRSVRYRVSSPYNPEHHLDTCFRPFKDARAEGFVRSYELSVHPFPIPLEEPLPTRLQHILTPEEERALLEVMQEPNPKVELVEMLVKPSAIEDESIKKTSDRLQVEWPALVGY